MAGSMLARYRWTRLQTLGRGAAVLLALSCLLNGGCAALTNPVGIGVPASRLPSDFLATSVRDLKTIPLTTLRQNPPEQYRLGAGDVVGVYIEGILGEKFQPPPVRFAEDKNVPPAIGFPIPVREDGSLPLPLIVPVPVKGMTMREAQDAVRKAYTVDQKILKADKNIFLSLTRKRTYHVQVVREDQGGGLPAGAGGLLQFQQRNTGAVLDLPAYDNDVLTALNQTGGLPSPQAVDEVIIERAEKGGGAKVTHIPLRMREGQPVPFGVEDVILNNGDVLYVKARRGEVFYTGGLLLPRQFVVPRDYDLHVVDAVAIAGGPIVNGAITQNNLTGNITSSGIGSPNPSRVTVLRRTKNEGQLAISVDLNLALRGAPGENIIIQGGDVIILQETPGEATTRYLLGILHLNYSDLFLNTSRNTANFTASGP